MPCGNRESILQIAGALSNRQALHELTGDAAGFIVEGMKVLSAEFVISAFAPEQCPGERLPEAAFAGRSNVGKSSLINSLLNRRKLARVSSTPGQTRAINFYRVNERYMFADLPGFGFAKVSQEERRSWRRMVETYLAGREELRAVVLIMDIRRVPGPEEKDLIGFLTAQGVAPVLAATKADKLGKTRRAKPLKEMGDALGVAPGSILVYSAVSGEGKDALWSKLLALMGQRG